jgi:hypothetical protein
MFTRNRPRWRPKACLLVEANSEHRRQHIVADRFD